MIQVGEVTASKYFSVAVELGDGKKKALPVRGESTGQVFQQVKQHPDVRRVGKVMEISQAAFEAIVQGREPASEAGPRPSSQGPPERSDKWIGHVITGPRVISHVRPSGEQPFKHLQAPPERPKSKKHEPAPRATEPVASGPPANARPSIEAGVASNLAPEYRVLKSRRQGGPPYLLQRGSWQQVKGKRAFHVKWEKDFATRAEAEAFRDSEAAPAAVK
jgi:hypothetical protein